MKLYEVVVVVVVVSSFLSMELRKKKEERRKKKEGTMAYVDPSIFLIFDDSLLKIDPDQNLTAVKPRTNPIHTMAANPTPEQQKSLARVKFLALRLHLESLKPTPHLQQECFVTIQEIAQANLGTALPADKDEYNTHRQYFVNAVDMYNDARPNHNQQWWNNIYNNMWCVRIFVDAVQLYCDYVLR
jgi:hypothetical protein